MSRFSWSKLSLVCLMGLLISISSQAGRIHVAVASNFMVTMQQLATAFKTKTGHDLIISSGSTGQLYAQIKQGAPYDVYMAADVYRPQLLIDTGLATQLHTYARGQLALLVNQQSAADCQSILTADKLQYLAIANPELAPYGLAAKQFLEYSQLWTTLSEQIVMGENVSQAMHMVVSKNATAGLVAQSLLVKHPLTVTQCQWLVPIDSYAPMNQAMVLLSQSKKVKLYNELLSFMQSKQGKDLIQNNGYLVGKQHD